jgi:hypothetical protein
MLSKQHGLWRKPDTTLSSGSSFCRQDGTQRALLKSKNFAIEENIRGNMYLEMYWMNALGPIWASRHIALLGEPPVSQPTTSRGVLPLLITSPHLTSHLRGSMAQASIASVRGLVQVLQSIRSHQKLPCAVTFEPDTGLSLRFLDGGHAMQSGISLSISVSVGDVAHWLTLKLNACFSLAVHRRVSVVF